MGNRFTICVVTLFVFFYNSSSLAADETKASLVFSGGRSVAQNACASPIVAVADPGYECSEDHAIYRLAYIYKFTPTWGIELSGGDVANANGVGTYTQGGTYPNKWQMKADGWAIAGIVNLTIGKSFSLFGKLGVIRTQLHEEDYDLVGGVWLITSSLNGVPVTGTEVYSPIYGVGFQYDFTKTYGIRVQYENFGQYDIYSYYGASTPEKVRITAASAGLVINF